MDSTKFEKQVLHPDYLKTCRYHYLYLGAVFIVLGILVFSYGYFYSLPTYEAVWERSAAVITKVVADSPKDQSLVDVAIRNMQSAKEGWINFMKEKTKNLTLIFSFVGVYLIGSYFRELRYRKLLLKTNVISVKTQ